AKYRRPAVTPPAPVQDEVQDVRPPALEDAASRGSGSGQGPRRFSGGLPRWLLAEAGSETAAPEENIEAAESSQAENPREGRSDADLSEDQMAALSSVVEAKHEETQDRAKADALVGGTEFEEVEAQDRFALTHEHKDDEEDEEEVELV